jgi:hypothetical protein
LKEKAKDVIRKERGVNRDEVVAFTVEDYVSLHGTVASIHVSVLLKRSAAARRSQDMA